MRTASSGGDSYGAGTVTGTGVGGYFHAVISTDAVTIICLAAISLDGTAGDINVIVIYIEAVASIIRRATDAGDIAAGDINVVSCTDAVAFYIRCAAGGGDGATLNGQVIICTDTVAIPIHRRAASHIERAGALDGQAAFALYLKTKLLLSIRYS